MRKLKLIRFKAFEGEVIIPLDDNKNFLLYGENGAGKSSIYEAIKVIFFKDRLEASLTLPGTPEELVQVKKDFWGSYNNKIATQDFRIEIDDLGYDTFPVDTHQVFMISIEELGGNDTLNLRVLIERFYIGIPNIDLFCEENCDLIEIGVNEALGSFLETISIKIDNEDDFSIKIIDRIKNIERKADIKRYFNEAKLNIIVILTLLSIIEIAKDRNKSKILVLDDFITSLDSSNRTFLIKYIFERFSDTQILIFTHNISFYNLIKYMITGTKLGSNEGRWVFANLFEINNKHKLYIKSEVEKVEAIQKDYNALTAPVSSNDIELVGNRVRKKFEILLYEFSKLLMIGAIEENRKILDRIVEGKSVYFNANNTPSDLVDSIEALSRRNPVNLAARLQATINTYKHSDFANLQKILKELKLYQKVTMHPMSHGVNGMPTFTTKEIEKSLELLDKMENLLQTLTDANVATV